MELALIYGFCLTSAALTVYLAFQATAERIRSSFSRTAEDLSSKLSDIFLDVPPQRLFLMCIGAPVATALALWMISGFWVVGVVLGTIMGLVMPKMLVRHIQRARYEKFHSQLVDSLLLISSSLKAGLSMLQAFGVLAEEMPAPISQEFGLIIKQTRMGINLDEAIMNLKRRIVSDEVTLITTAVLVARETGGDVTHVFERLVETLRERRKLRERIKTLTFMARMQGVVMGLVPFAFAYMVYQMNHEYFSYFLNSPRGRMLLLLVIVLQSVGAVLFARFSRSPL